MELDRRTLLSTTLSAVPDSFVQTQLSEVAGEHYESGED